MSRVRRRIRLLEAVQYDGSLDCAQRLAAFAPGLKRETPGLLLPTGRGPLRVFRGDWLVRDPDTLDVSVVANAQFFRDYDHLGGVDEDPA